ncbi:serine hydrolase [Spirosoma utsteinense]|uniref:CubicO group peptidase (Beta-lactamase class C family) n=1 Tax=Spirosoma utsteinense TaxID=2585773 RepID=A0ABR6W340_9BACT|nr:serine hydrolase [Spirosoma utsteinense]MBC3786637.1 CubicO group peptidase (beta-lactamase class C family) [Spirosoma utsteinense]MBC3791000.1 CubicO group peptidase (beta-lactamase class C family) [Spirosoma utsteinense]
MRSILFIFILFGGTLVVRPLLAQKKRVPADPVARYDAYVEQAVRDWRVPGLTVTVVKDGKVLLKKGYGVRKQVGAGSGAPEPVNSQTLFAMASTTKAMTAACLGMLVDEGKLNWDDPVTDYLPDFQLYDPAVTRDIRVRDLLTHNAGLGNADFLWSAMQIPANEILHRLRLIKPAYSLRAGFIYQNIMYLAAGKVIEKVSGLPWDVFIRQRIFEPLGMSRTRALFREVTDANRAMPHVMINDTIRLVESRIEEGSVDAVGPAGSVWSCPDDLVAWMRCMLDTARYNSGGVTTKALLTPATWAELFRPQTLVTDGQFYPTQQLTKPSWKTYGLGWFQHDYRGHRVNFHTGSLTGMVAIHGQLPDQKLAVYVQANLDHAELRHALMYRAFDEFGLDPTDVRTVHRDWSTEFRLLYGRLQQRAKLAERTADSTRVINTKPSLPLTAYAGTYLDPLYGKVDVSVQQGKLHLSINNMLTGSLSHWHYDTFRLTYDQFWNGSDTVGFLLDTQGNVAKLSWGGVELAKVVAGKNNAQAAR